MHTKLDLEFDWERQWVNGEAYLDFQPYFHDTDSLLIDAKGFELRSVSLFENGQKTPLSYTYDSLKLNVKLGRKYTREETFTIFIDYVAKPEELEKLKHRLHTPDKGLYFINPEGTDKRKPQQIWTQGETEASSCWFPTIDAPNERTTQEINLTVQDRFTTLSNGLLVKQTSHPNGTRTDTWKQTIPHAPYLFAIVIGEFEVYKDSWNGIEVSYYLEKEYAPYAETIFGPTPEMIDFFSEITGFPYPWEKFSQVVVRDFVSGAMENTTCVIHYDNVQHDPREHLDDDREDIIAHELFHHWFGDMVTCESWANLPLNEGFANYGEYLWKEHKHGKMEADRVIQHNLDAYLSESRYKREPLIRYHHHFRDDMFDGHSYQKGARVIHMLRNYVGDDAFFASLKLYLNRNAFSSVEIHDLRKAFEETTGEDLNWFFDQWFLYPGHPELDISYEYDPTHSEVSVHLQQVQNLTYMPVYKLPTKLKIQYAGHSEEVELTFSTQDTLLKLPVQAKPVYLSFDPDRVLLAFVNEQKSYDEWQLQTQYGEGYSEKRTALAQLDNFILDGKPIREAANLLKDPFWGIRYRALHLASLNSSAITGELFAQICQIAGGDPSAKVRRKALAVLETALPSEGLKSTDLKEKVRAEGQIKMLRNILDGAVQDSSYGVQGQALNLLYQIDSVNALPAIKKIDPGNSDELRNKICNILIDAGDPEVITYVKQSLNEIDPIWKRARLLLDFSEAIKDYPPALRSSSLDFMMDLVRDPGPRSFKVIALQALAPFKDESSVEDFFRSELVNTSDPGIREFCQEQLGEKAKGASE